MPTCLTCAMWSGDPEHEFGWCYEEEQPTGRNNPQCEVAKDSLRDEPLKAAPLKELD